MCRRPLVRSNRSGQTDRVARLERARPPRRRPTPGSRDHAVRVRQGGHTNAEDVSFSISPDGLRVAPAWGQGGLPHLRAALQLLWQLGICLSRLPAIVA